MIDEQIKLEIATLWKAFLGGLVMQAGSINMREQMTSITIEPMSINATLVHLEDRSLALHMDLDSAAGTWMLQNKGCTLEEGQWGLVPDGVLVYPGSNPLAPLTAAGSFLDLLNTNRKTKN